MKQGLFDSGIGHDPILKYFKNDLFSGVVIFIISIPLCLGIAQASGVPPISGLVSGVVGGLLVGVLSKAQLNIVGPAAGLVIVVLSGVSQLGGDLGAFLVACLIAGVLQFILGVLKAGTLGNLFPSSVVKGMMASIGLILIFKQIPHGLGYDKIGKEDDDSPLSFLEHEDAFRDMMTHLTDVHWGALFIFAVGLLIMIYWHKWVKKDTNLGSILSAPLVAVLVGTLMNQFFRGNDALFLSHEHLVQIPPPGELYGKLPSPQWSAFLDAKVYFIAIMVVFVTSLETLLSTEAVEKLDPYKRLVPLNWELKAQGIGNMACALLGGLPMTCLIMRSTAGVATGAKTKMTTITTGVLLLISILTVGPVLNQIPLASLAAVLVMIGYRLTSVEVVISILRRGWAQFMPFVITIVAVLLTNLLYGVLVGLVVGVIFVTYSSFIEAVVVTKDGNQYLIRFSRIVSFLNKVTMRRILYDLPEGAYVIIDGTKSAFIADDVMEIIEDFSYNAKYKNITVELKKRPYAANAHFRGAIN